MKEKNIILTILFFTSAFTLHAAEDSNLICGKDPWGEPSSKMEATTPSSTDQGSSNSNGKQQNWTPSPKENSEEGNEEGASLLLPRFETDPWDDEP